MLLVTHIDTYESLDEDIQFKIDNGLDYGLLKMILNYGKM